MDVLAFWNECDGPCTQGLYKDFGRDVEKYLYDTVDGRNPATVEVGSFSHYLEGFIYPRWFFTGFPPT